MIVDIISIGDEVLYGYTINSNAKYLAQKLLQFGIGVNHHIVIGDDEQEIEKTVKESLERASLTIITGGLGPTLDDKTRPVIAKIFKHEICYNKDVSKWIEENFGRVETLENQSMQIKGAQILYNRLGTAPGFILEKGFLVKKTLIALPGVPEELYHIVENEFDSIIKEKFKIKEKNWIEPLHFVRLVEADVDPFLRDLQNEFPKLTFGIYPSQNKISVHIGAKTKSEKEFHATTAEVKKRLLDRFQEYYFESPNGNLDELIHNMLIEKKITLSVGESCTAGFLSATLAKHRGASKYLLGGIIAYNDSVKKNLLSVNEKTLNTFGAVSIETTEEMAANLLKKFNSDLAISVSGILGPDGGSIEKPVGTICITIQCKDEKPFSWVAHFNGEREVIRQKAVNQIFAELYFFLRKNFNRLPQ